jgi:hypothetical protein
LLQDILQLAHVPWPRIAQEPLHGGRRELGVVCAGVWDALENGPDEQAEVLSALAQGRQLEPTAQAFPEIHAKRPVVHQPREIAMGGRYDPQIDTDLGRATDGPQRLLLEYPQELALQPERKLTYLVEEQRAPGGRGDQAVSAGHGTGERPPDVAEQLALDEPVGEPCAIHRHERAAATG